MESRDERSPSRPLAFCLFLFSFLRTENAICGPGPIRLELAGPSERSALEHAVTAAVRDAASKLSDASCRQVFSDFRDPAGRTIGENLDALGHTPQSYLSLILFYNGYGYQRCDARATLASTSPGSRAVYICAPQFLEKEHRDPGHAAAIIIHEELHSLGLGEDPPSSKEITARVISRCGL